MKNRKQGFTLVEIMIVVMIIGLLAAIALPGFQRAREASQTNACINNMRILQDAQDQYAIEEGVAGTDPALWADIEDYVRGAEPECPLGGTYTLVDADTAPVCPNVATAADHVLNM